MAELWANNARSSLAAGIADDATSLTVATGQGALFPNPTGADYFWATIDNGTNLEIIKVTARSTDSFTTIERAQQGTTARDWSIGTRIVLRITRETLEDLQANVVDDSSGVVTDAEYWVETASGGLSSEIVVGTTGITTAAYASRQAAAKAGRLFLPNNGFVIERDAGAAWAPWGPLFPFTAPVDGDFSWVNQGGATVATTNGGIVLTAPASATASIRARVKTAPATPYTITAAFLYTGSFNNFFEVGLLFRESGTSEMHVLRILYNAEIQIASTKYTNETTVSTNYDADDYFSSPLVWMQISDDGANRICRYSSDGQNWFTYHTIGRTDFLTADQVGFFADSINSQPVVMTLLSWKEGS